MPYELCGNKTHPSTPKLQYCHHKSHPPILNLKLCHGVIEGNVEYTEVTKVAITCKFCGSDNVIKYGHKDGIQYYFCNNCKRKFAANNALPGMRYPPDQIASALNQFYEGLSLNATRRHLEHDYDVLPSDATVYEWVVRFTRQAADKARSLVVDADDIWLVDETVLQLDQKDVWFWDIICAESRYLLASYLSFTRSYEGRHRSATLRSTNSKTATPLYHL